MRNSRLIKIEVNVLKFKIPKNIIWGFVGFVILLILYKTLDNFNVVAAWFSNVIGILKPFIIGFVIAYILNIPADAINKRLSSSKYAFIKKHTIGLSIGCVYVIFLALIVLLIRMIIPAIYKNILDLYNNLPYYAKVVTEYLSQIEIAEKINLLNINPVDIINKLYAWITGFDFSKFGTYAQGVINVTSGVINIFLSIVISIYMLIDKNRIKKQVKYIMNAFMPVSAVEKATKNIATFNDILSKYIYCQLLDASIVALLSIIVMSIIRVRYSLILGLLIGICNLIPYFGAIIAIVVTIFVTCFTGGMAKGIWTLIALVLMQQIDANIIGPRIMSNSLELRPLLVIFAVTLGGGLFGIPGMLLSVPVLAMIKVLAERYIQSRVDKKSEDIE